uniref:Uncharacterized protein n=1 Tax=Polytomella parva TaxID=51329 RepID=A0A7S0V125_9CHLO
MYIKSPPQQSSLLPPQREPPSSTCSTHHLLIPTSFQKVSEKLSEQPSIIFATEDIDELETKAVLVTNDSAAEAKAVQRGFCDIFKSSNVHLGFGLSAGTSKIIEGTPLARSADIKTPKNKSRILSD